VCLLLCQLTGSPVGLSARPRESERHLISNVGNDGLGHFFSVSGATGVLKVTYEGFDSGNRVPDLRHVAAPESIGLRCGEFLEEFLPRHHAPISCWHCSVSTA
jgi:hypothetical protein